MAVEEETLETMEYRLVLVEPGSRKVLALDGNESYRLPRVRIPMRARPAEQLGKASKAAWGLDILILDFFPSHDASWSVAVAQLLSVNASEALSPVAPESIGIGELSEQQRAYLADVLGGHTKSPLSRLGWIDEAVAWLESVTQRKLSSKTSIHQLNAGGAFSLLRFGMEDGRCYWLKATGEPNAHELSVTRLLSELCGDYLPELIASRPSWNAWLTSEEATQVTNLPTDPFKIFQLLEDAVESMAELQARTAGHLSAILSAGAFDQRIEVFQRHSEAVFDYLEEAMGLQISTKVPQLSKSSLRESRTLFEDVCHRMEDLCLPQTIVHGDLNLGNILSGSGQCRFIDWCEAYIGDPLISLQNLLRLNTIDNRGLRIQINQALQRRYRDVWATAFDPMRFENGFPYMEVLAIFSSLLGRGDWLTSPKRNDPRLQSYSRTLARHLDRAVREPELMEALCG